MPRSGTKGLTAKDAGSTIHVKEGDSAVLFRCKIISRSLVHNLLHARKREVEGRTAIDLPLGPGATAVAADDATNVGKPDA